MTRERWLSTVNRIEHHIADVVNMLEVGSEDHIGGVTEMVGVVNILGNYTMMMAEVTV